MGAYVHQVTKEEYTRRGSVALGEQLAAELRAQVRPHLSPKPCHPSHAAPECYAMWYIHGKGTFVPPQEGYHEQKYPTRDQRYPST